MDLVQIFLYFIFAFFLFFLLNYCKKLEEKTPSIVVILPVIYIILISSFFFLWKDMIYLVILFEMFIRIYYEKIILNQQTLDTKYYQKTYGLSLILGFFITNFFLMKIDSIFLTVEEMRIGIWLLIGFFFYKVLNGNLSFSLEKKQKEKEDLEEETVVVQYAKLKTRYFSILKTTNQELQLLFYAMMIYEDYHRSNFLRKLDRIHFRFTGRTMKLGIMQVETNREITDLESVKIAWKKLNKIEKEIVLDKSIKKQNKNPEILMTYYEKEEKIPEILRIYSILKEFCSH